MNSSSTLTPNERKQQLEQWRQKKALQNRNNIHQVVPPKSIKPHDAKSETRSQLNCTGSNFVSKLQSNTNKQPIP